MQLNKSGLEVDKENMDPRLQEIANELKEIFATLMEQRQTRCDLITITVADHLLRKYKGQGLEKMSKRVLEKHRRECGTTVELLLTILLRLDSIESRGQACIKKQRHRLVSKINKKLLPMADSTFSAAERLLAFRNRLKKFFDDASETSSDGASVTSESGSSQMVEDATVDQEPVPEKPKVEAEPENEQDEVTDEAERKAVEEPEDEQDETHTPDETSNKEAKVKEEVEELPYEIKVRHDGALISIELPSEEFSIEDFGLKLTGENQDHLELTGQNGLQQEFVVDTSSFDVRSTEYVVLGNVLRIFIPRQTTRPKFLVSSTRPRPRPRYTEQDLFAPLFTRPRRPQVYPCYRSRYDCSPRYSSFGSFVPIWM